jgi:hypothetical protein
MLKNPHEDVVGESLVESPWTQDNGCLNASAEDRRLIHLTKKWTRLVMVINCWLYTYKHVCIIMCVYIYVRLNK